MKILKLSVLTMSLVMFASCKINAQSNSGNKSSENGNRKGPPPSADEIFEMMDADKNGLLEVSEVKGPIKNNFETIDTDQDSFITKEELEAAPKPERKGGKGKRK